MFYDTDIYTFRIEELEGARRFFVSFIDERESKVEIEVSKCVYEELCISIKVERKIKHFYERHIEYSELTDEELYVRAFRPSENIEDAMVRRILTERVMQVLETLPEIQRRRFVLYHEFDLTLAQIAEIEGCSKMSVKRAIDRAEEKIQEEIKKFTN